MSPFALGWSLIHSLWQGALVALALAAVLALVDRKAAGARYALSCGALAVLALLPVVTYFQVGVATESVGSVVVVPGGGVGIGGVEVEEPEPSPVPHRLGEALTPTLPWIVVAWLAGVLAFSVRLAGGWLRVRRLLSKPARPAPEPARETLARLAEDTGLRRVVRLLESPRVSSPLVVGWLRPAVLVPPAAFFGLDPRQLEAILAHELAHVRRHDYLVNLVQSLVEVLLFYHPAAWWISRQVRTEREHCCDDAGAAACGDPLIYARALVRLEELRRPGPCPARGLAVAAAGRGRRGTLLARARRLLEPAGGEGAGALTAVLLALLALLGGALGTGTLAAGSVAGPAEDRPALVRLPPSPADTFSAEERVLLARYSVDEGYVRELERAGLSGLGADELVTLRRYDVDGEYVSALARLGYRDLCADQLATLRRYAVEPEWVERLQEAGYRDVPIDTLVTLRRYGVEAGRP